MTVIDWNFVNTIDLELALEEVAIRDEPKLYVYYRSGGQ